MTASVRFEMTDAAFLAFCAALAQEREAAGAGPAARIGIGQRADAMQIIQALNRAGGWLGRGTPTGAETAETVFARHLGPVLCESPAMQAALRRVLARDRVPGTFRPALPHIARPDPPPEPAPPPGTLAVYLSLLGVEFRRLWLRIGDVARSRRGRVLMAVGGVAVALSVAAPGLMRGLADRCLPGARPVWPVSVLPLPECERSTVVDLSEPTGGQTATDAGGAVRFPLTENLDTAASEVNLGPLHRALAALERSGFDLSPALLAEYLAATAPVTLDPALYLDAMLTRWPLPSDRPVPRSRIGALAVVNFGMATAELEGDAGALAAIRARLPGLAQGTQAAAFLPDDLYLPDAPLPEDDAGIALDALAQIDPRLARLAVDDVTADVWSVAESVFDEGELPLLSSLNQIQPLQQIQLQAQQPFLPPPRLPLPFDRDADLRLTVTGDRLLFFAASLTERFGVPPGFDPGGTEPVTLNAIIAEIRMALQTRALLDASFQTRLEPWRAEIDLLVLVPPVLALIWALAGFRPALRRRLETWPKLPAPQFHLVVPAPDQDHPALANTARRVAQTLRHTPPRVTASLDVEASLARTLRQGGYFQPVLRTRRDVAAHLVLIHRRTLAEHEPRRIAALFGQLQAMGVAMVLFEYAADPARLLPFGQRGVPPRDLDSLLQDYPEARLIVVTTGDEFTGAGAYGASAASIRALRHWDRRAVVTPVPVGNWGLREWALSAQLSAPLARAAPDGLPDLAAIFPSDIDGPAVAPPTLTPGSAADWLGRMRAARAPGDPVPPLPPLLDIPEAEAALPHAPQEDRIEALVASLRRWLGPQGYLWLQACVSYPVLRYPLTRWLGEQLFGEKVPLRALAQLSLLGWFAVGRMPVALAERLRRDLGKADEARIEALFTRFFKDQIVSGASPAQDAGRGYRGERIAYEPDPLRNRIAGARQMPVGLGADPEAEAARQRQIRLSVLADRAAVVLAAGVLAIALWAVWPVRTDLPLPPGAWLPVAAVGVTGVAVGMSVMVGLAALRRLRIGRNRARPPPERAGIGPGRQVPA